MNCDAHDFDLFWTGIDLNICEMFLLTIFHHSLCCIFYRVTRATVTYNAPARNCPTADNVMVNVDLSLTFRIGPDPEAAANFIYKLGAHRFDELIAAETEEAIRGLVYSVTHDNVNDLREEFAVGMLSTLNSKVAVYGVQIMNVKITDVTLPPDLQDRLERTTAFKTKMSEQEKSHENRVRVLEDEATRSIETIRKSNSRKLQEIEAERMRYDIERREMEETARGVARVEEIKAMTDADVALKKSLGSETVHKVMARQDAEALLKKTHIQCQTMKIDSEKRINVEVKNSEADLAVAESKAVSCAYPMLCPMPPQYLTLGSSIFPLFTTPLIGCHDCQGRS